MVNRNGFLMSILSWLYILLFFCEYIEQLLFFKLVSMNHFLTFYDLHVETILSLISHLKVRLLLLFSDRNFISVTTLHHQSQLADINIFPSSIDSTMTREEKKYSHTPDNDTFLTSKYVYILCHISYDHTTCQ